MSISDPDQHIELYTDLYDSLPYLELERLSLLAHEWLRVAEVTQSQTARDVYAAIQAMLTDIVKYRRALGMSTTVDKFKARAMADEASRMAEAILKAKESLFSKEATAKSELS